MLDLYFGLDASGFEKSGGLPPSVYIITLLTVFHITAQFHDYLGPIMMVTYACLSNTLLLTGALALNSFSKQRLMVF